MDTLTVIEDSAVLENKECRFLELGVGDVLHD